MSGENVIEKGQSPSVGSGSSGSAPVVLTAEQWESIVAGIRHDGQLVTKLRREVEILERYKQRMEWLHDCSTGCTDADGFEWGIYRVKWENGQAVQVWQTNSDFSDLDAEMAREASLQNVADDLRPPLPDVQISKTDKGGR